MTNIVGNDFGIRLWGLMYQSTDQREIDYVKQLQNVAVKYGKFCYSDLITQIETGQNQTIWQMNWNQSTNNWEVSLFFTPEGASLESPRLKKPIEIDVEISPDEWMEIDPNDIISI